VRGPGFEIWYGRRQRLNPARGKGAMSSDSAGDCLQLSPAENPLPPLSFRDLHSARPGRPFRKSGTGGSNPVPSSGESCKLSVPLSAMNSALRIRVLSAVNQHRPGTLRKILPLPSRPHGGRHRSRAGAARSRRYHRRRLCRGRDRRAAADPPSASGRIGDRSPGCRRSAIG